MQNIKTSVLLFSVMASLGITEKAFSNETDSLKNNESSIQGAISDSIVISISKDGSVFCGSTKIGNAQGNTGDLVNALNKNAANKKSAAIINADNETKHAYVVKVYNAIKTIGIKNIDFSENDAIAHSSESKSEVSIAAQREMANETNIYNDKEYLSRFSPFEPTYFAAGIGNDSVAKFQFSFKLKIFGEEEFDQYSPKAPFYSDIYLAYSQTSLWDISETSKPFYDSSYRPSVFYYKSNFFEDLSWINSIGVRSGFEHESNGKGGDESRSINIGFIQPIFHWQWDQMYLTFAPKFFAYIDKNENNTIDEYRGYADWIIEGGITDSFKANFIGRIGNDWEHGSMEVNLTYPINNILPFINTYLHFQYFNGYGESLLDYNKKRDTQFRLGVMLFR